MAEDDPTNQYTTQKLLEKLGHTVILAEDGQQVLDLLKDHEFDVILMDVQMPVMNGIDATKRIRSQESGAWTKSFDPQVSDLTHETARRVPSQRQGFHRGFSPQPSRRIPIIALTAYAMAGDREKFLEAGMDDYISKPVRMQDLEKLLSRHSK